MFGLMRGIAPEIPANDTVPCGVVLFIEFFLEISGNVLFNVVFFKGVSGTVHGILLHVFTHVSIFNHSLLIAYNCCKINMNQKLNVLFNFI